MRVHQKGLKGQLVATISLQYNTTAAVDATECRVEKGKDSALYACPRERESERIEVFSNSLSLCAWRPDLRAGKLCATAHGVRACGYQATQLWRDNARNKRQQKTGPGREAKDKRQWSRYIHAARTHLQQTEYVVHKI